MPWNQVVFEKKLVGEKKQTNPNWDFCLNSEASKIKASVNWSFSLKVVLSKMVILDYRYI